MKNERIIKLLESLERDIDKLLEYERYVSPDGKEYDDEGNVINHGSDYGRRYGGNTYNRSPGTPRRYKKDMFTGEDYEVDEKPKVSSSTDRMISKIKQQYIDKGKSEEEAERIARAVARKRKKESYEKPDLSVDEVMSRVNQAIDDGFYPDDAITAVVASIADEHSMPPNVEEDLRQAVDDLYYND